MPLACAHTLCRSLVAYVATPQPLVVHTYFPQSGSVSTVRQIMKAASEHSRRLWCICMVEVRSKLDDDPQFLQQVKLIHSLTAVVDVQWESWATVIALACSTQFAILLRALNQQLAKHETTSKALAEVAPAVKGLLSLPGADQVRHLSQHKHGLL